MSSMPYSPKIISATWGSVDVEGIGKLKDALLYPGGGREWDWNETGMHHNPGVRSIDVAELISREVTVIVIGNGFEGSLQVVAETLKYLEGKGISIYVKRTPEAVEIYNRYTEHQLVGGLFHSTC